MIPFNKPFITGKETGYISDAVSTGKISGNGKYTGKCQQFLEQRYGYIKTLLTTSCTDALEMCALLLDLKQGDEVIVPSYSFVSTALAFVRQGAKIIFVDSHPDHPCLDENIIEPLITPKTRAIVVVHYAGVSCNMQKIMELADTYGLFVVEDAASAINGYYHNSDGISHPLGSIGHLGCFSFHDTKNIQCGEGGMLVINDERFVKRAEIIWEKGTNRAEFFRGEIDKYSWVDIGSSFLPSEITAAFLWAQLEVIDDIQKKRGIIWIQYHQSLQHWAAIHQVKLPFIPPYATHNAHMFYLVCPTAGFRDRLIRQLKDQNIHAVFHYQSLHQSPYYRSNHDGRELVNAWKYSERLVRLPLFNELTTEDTKCVVETIENSMNTN